MKRRLAGLLAVIILLGSITACGTTGQTDRTDEQTQETSEQTENVQEQESPEQTEDAQAQETSGQMEDAQAQTWQTVEDAYIYTLPLVLVKATLDKMTNTEEATSKQAPWNQLIHAADLATAESRDVVTPNVDTVYTQLCLDMGKDAVVFEKPATKRFCSVEVIDAYTNCRAILGTGGDTSQACTYLFTGPDFHGEVPEGMTEIKMPTSLGWIIVRTVCRGEDDLAQVARIQKQMKSYTLSQYQSGDTEQMPQGSYDADKDYIPVQYVLGLSPEEYFDLANELMTGNPPVAEDEAAIEEFREIGVGPGMDFDSAILGEDASQRWKTMVDGLRTKLMESCGSFMVQNGIWQCYGEPIAEFGCEYRYRALVALAGLGANPVSVALYPKSQTDSAGERLNGENKYILHFEKDALPPVEQDGFWSITAYDSANDLLIDNELNRYCINDRSDLVYNEDGSLDLYLQASAPQEEKMSNWLPVCTGDFHLYMRIYLPADSVVSGSWEAPDIIRAD